MDLGNLHLLRPWWLLSFIPLSIILWRLWQYSNTAKLWQEVCAPHLLPLLLEKKASHHRQRFFIALTIAWVCTILALCGPSFKRVPQSVYKAQQAQVIVLDLSDNMLAADIKPDRLTRARYKVLDILAQSKEQQTGLIVFTSEPFVVSPLTQDAQTIAAMVPTIVIDTVPVAGENIGAALIKAAELFKQAGIHNGHIILLTATTPTNTDKQIAENIYKQGYRLSVLGIGTSLGAPVPTSQDTTVLAKLAVNELTQLAMQGGGKYFAFNDTNADIDTLLDVSQLQPQAKAIHQTVTTWIDQGYWILIPVLIIAALMFRRGWFEDFIQ